MKILLVSTFEYTGGAAIACKRLYESLKQSGAEVKMLVGVKSSDDENISTAIDNNFKKIKYHFRFYSKKFSLLKKVKNKEDIFFFSISKVGENISNHPWVKEADIIHIHWINHGFLSITSIKQLLSLNKKVVWTLHDMWAFTGGCHYSGNCKNYQVQCGNCPYLSIPDEKDISRQNWLLKNDLIKKSNIQFITCSKWLCETARSSGLLKNKDVVSIPNPIDTNLFTLKNKNECKTNLNLPTDKKIVLFGAQNISDKRKGFDYLKEAVKLIKSDNIEIAVFGKFKENLQQYFNIKVHVLGKLNLEKVIEAYNAADVYVLPSLEDNLPNTVMEALACGTSVTAFKTGGIPEMIDHKANGYLAEYLDATDLAQGIEWCLSNNINTREKILDNFSYSIISEKHLQLYRSLY